MRITVTDSAISRSGDFREGSRVSDIIAALGFEFELPCGGAGRCGKCLCRVNGSEKQACRTQLFADATVEIPASNAYVLTADETVDGAEGVVIDIGTTTVAAALFRQGRPVKTLGRRNPQCAWGADVISRIGAADTAPLTRAIQELVRELRREMGPDENTVITGNTAMLALLCGMETREMGAWPFPLPSGFDIEFEGAWLPPCASAFIGADALCSMLRAGNEDGTLMVDLGTNGEIGLLSKGSYSFTSAAAGPALEGGNISQGMSASAGAIYRVDAKGYKTVGGERPRGVCGSGLVDAVALMLEQGEIDPFGAVRRDFEIHGSGVFINQADIRSFQLCKGAISAGIQILLRRRGVAAENVKRICLSGALGENLDIRNSVRVGLLPRVPLDRFVPIGNGALLGGAMLLKEGNRRRVRSMALNCTCLDLVADTDFTDEYMKNINF